MRNVKESAWKKFKARAASRGMSVGDYFSEVVAETEHTAKNPWDKILNRKGIFTDKDAEDMHKAIKEFRRE